MIHQSYIALFSVVVMFAALVLGACPGKHELDASDSSNIANFSVPKDRTVVEYWESWTNFEFDAVKDIVDRFNESQDDIYVKIVSVSEIERKVLIATAGNNPPDLVNFLNNQIPILADKGALEPLEPLLPILEVEEEDYLDVFWKLCRYKGKLYGLPSTPISAALYWNKKLFRDAGLDPERAPNTIAELNSMAEKLTRKRADGSYETLGFVQTQPSWWPFFWVYPFGGGWWTNEQGITANCPENIAAFKWIQTTAERLGPKVVQNFTSGLETSEASGNGFFSGQVAMILQGVWLPNFIKVYAPDLEWGVAPFPTVDGTYETTLVQTGLFVIPRGSKHKEAAAKFIAYTQRPENLEYLSLKHTKFMPLKSAKTIDYSTHPNKAINVFVQVADSPHAAYEPQIPIWNEYSGEIFNAFQAVWLGTASPEKALDLVQERMQKSWQRYERIQKLIDEQEKRP